MRTIRAAIALGLFALLTSCVGTITTPTSSPAATSAAPTPTAASTATAPVSPTPRSIRPFARVQRITLTGDPEQVAPDRERIAYVASSGELNVVEVATGQAKKVHTPQQGWHLDLDPHGLRGDALVFRESRTDGQRTDVRIMRIDLRTGVATTLDDFSGPFLGGGDNWQARAPITNGVSAAWIRVDDGGTPFGIHVVLQLAVQGGPRTIQSGSSAVWIDLDDADGVAISTLITPDQVAELVVWREGQRLPIASRPSAEGGPAVFAGGSVFWGIGPRIVRPVLRGALFDVNGRSRALDLGCSWSGNTARYLVIDCQGAGTTLVDAQTGDRIVTEFGRHPGSSAIAWREGAQWWLGILTP